MARSTAPNKADDMDPSEFVGDATGGQDVLGTDQLNGQTAFVDESGVEIAYGPATNTVMMWCAENRSFGDGDTAAAMEAMVARVLAGESADEILSEEMTVKVDSILDKTILIHGIRIGETEFTEGFPFYALVDVTLGGEDRHQQVTVGAFKVMAQLYALDKLAEFPVVAMFKKADKPTRGGYYPISLTRPKTL